jgi:hypothetical protein
VPRGTVRCAKRQRAVQFLKRAVVQGTWWLPAAGELDSRFGGTGGTVLPEEDEGKELIQLAAAARMNTATRRAVFCAVMGAHDYVDAAQRLLALPLKVFAF